MALKSEIGSDARKNAYLGLWCLGLRNNVPLFIKIFDRLGKEIPVEYFNVPKKASRDVKFYVEEMNVEQVPTFIFYWQGKELGRIVENASTGMMKYIMGIFSSRGISGLLWIAVESAGKGGRCGKVETERRPTCIQ